MAGEEVLGSARFVITGEGGGAVQAVNQANDAFSKLEQAVATNWWGLQNLGVAFAALPAAVAGGIGVAVSHAKRWEDAMFDVQRTSGETGDALQRIEDGLLAAARVTPIATTELAAFAAEGAALGIANKDLAEFAQIMGVLVASTDLTEGNLADVSRVLNIMGVPVEEYENFASTLIDVGRNTAATETEITNFGRRIAGVAKVSEVSADEVLALSAAVLSLGPRAESGATGLTRTFTQMASAIAEGGETLDYFAQIAGMTVEEFADTFRRSGTEAFAAFVTGLGRVEDGFVGLSEALQLTGADGQRQIQALAALAAGTRDVGNEQTDLNAMLALGSQSWRENTSLAEIEAARLQTLSGQLEIVKNLFFEVGQALGNIFVPYVKTAVEVVANLVSGLQHIPGPIRIIFAVLGIGVTAISGFLAMLALVGPRIVIAVGFLRQLSNANNDVVASSGRATASQRNLAIAMQTAGIDAQVAAGRMSALQGAYQKLVIASQQETAAINVNSVAKQRNAGITGLLIGVYRQFATTINRTTMALLTMTAAMIGLAYWTARQGEAARKAAKKRTDSNRQLKRDLSEISGLQENASASERNFLEGQKAQRLRTSDQYREMAGAAKDLGVSIGELDNIIQRQGDTTSQKSLLGDLFSKEEQGSDSAKVLLNNLTDLRDAYGSATPAINDATGALDDFSEAATGGGGGGGKGGAAGAAEDVGQALDKIARAHVDYIDAMFAQRQANINLRESEEDLAEARERLANIDEEIASAELNISSARNDHRRALWDLEEAERNLTTARQEGRDDLADAEDSLLDAQDAYAESLEKITDLEQDLADLRSGPTIDEITKATNDLRNAQLRLLGANRKVSDAEWQLQYLRQQGASNRDIEDAEFTLMNARQDVLDQQQEVADAEGDLSELRDESVNQEEVARLERDIASARRDSEEALRNISDRERELDNVRRRVAGDRYYHEAQADLVDAQIGVANSLDRIQDAEEELEAIRSGSLIRDVEQAQLDYERSLYGVATANTEVARQQAAMNGEFWTAGDAAQHLAGQLGHMLGNIPDDAARQRMQDFINILNSAPAGYSIGVGVGSVDTGGLAGGLGGINMGDIGAGMGADLMAGLEGEIDRYLDENGGDSLFGDMGEPSWWEPLIPMLGFAAGPAIGRALLSAATHGIRFLAGAITGIGLGWAALAVGLQAAWGWVLTQTDLGRSIQIWFQEEVQDPIQNAGGWIVEGLWAGISGAWDWFTTQVTALWEGFVKGVRSFFGISSPSTVFKEIGADIIRGLVEGIQSLPGILTGAATWVKDKILEGFSSVGTWLLDTGGNIASGLWDGFSGVWENTVGTLDPKAIFEGIFSNPKQILEGTGFQTGQGLWNGISAAWEGTIGGWNPVTAIRGLFGDPRTQLNGVGYNLMVGLVDGLQAAGNYVNQVGGAVMQGVRELAEREFGNNSPSKVFAVIGKDLMLGLAKGMEDNLEPVEQAAKEMFNAAVIEDAARKNNLDHLLSGGSFSGRAMQSLTPATTINYGDTVTIEVDGNPEPAKIVNAWAWNKRIKKRG